MGAINMPNGDSNVVGVYAMDTEWLNDEEVQELRESWIAGGVIEEEDELSDDDIRSRYDEDMGYWLSDKFDLVKTDLADAVAYVMKQRCHDAGLDVDDVPFTFEHGHGYYSGWWFALQAAFTKYTPFSCDWWDAVWDTHGQWIKHMEFADYQDFVYKLFDALTYVITEFVHRERIGYVAGRSWTSHTQPYDETMALEKVEEYDRWHWRYPEYHRNAQVWGGSRGSRGLKESCDVLELPITSRPLYRQWSIKQMYAKERAYVNG